MSAELVIVRSACGTWCKYEVISVCFYNAFDVVLLGVGQWSIGHLELWNRAPKCENPKNPGVLLFLVIDVHVVHRPTNLNFRMPTKITKKVGLSNIFLMVKD